jgi:hypothetical protein
MEKTELFNIENLFKKVGFTFPSALDSAEEINDMPNDQAPLYTASTMDEILLQTEFIDRCHLKFEHVLKLRRPTNPNQTIFKSCDGAQYSFHILDQKRPEAATLSGFNVIFEASLGRAEINEVFFLHLNHKYELLQNKPKELNQNTQWIIKETQSPKEKQKVFNRKVFIPKLADFSSKASNPLALKDYPIFGVLKEWPEFIQLDRKPILYQDFNNTELSLPITGIKVPFIAKIKPKGRLILHFEPFGPINPDFFKDLDPSQYLLKVYRWESILASANESLKQIDSIFIHATLIDNRRGRPVVNFNQQNINVQFSVQFERVDPMVFDHISSLPVLNQILEESGLSFSFEAALDAKSYSPR